MPMPNSNNAQLQELLELTHKEQASDLHLSAGHPPIMRIAGTLVPLVKKKILSPKDTETFAKALLKEEQYQRFLVDKEIDFSFSAGQSRFRVNVFLQRGSVSFAFRLIPAKIKTIEELNLPPVLHEFTRAAQGFVLMTGPSSHGKSTTLAALIDEINSQRADHIITIEDPIEYIFTAQRAIIDQREVFQDTMSFARALKSTFRQDPNVIMVGEMRDPETMATAITAAETGHLVFSTIHTNSASQTIDRIIDSFPAEQQGQISSQLAATLVGIVSERLIPRIDGGRVPACEVMISNPAIRNLIREKKSYQIDLVIETSMQEGMLTLNRSIAELIKKKEISLESGELYSLNPSELRILLERS